MHNVNKLNKDALLKQEEYALKRKIKWQEMKPFKSIEDIPHLPIVDSEEWNNFYIPILIKCGAIPKKDLKKDGYYEGTCRNADKAQWNGDQFIYEREKFGCKFLEKINHFEDDNHADLFVPLNEITK